MAERKRGVLGPLPGSAIFFALAPGVVVGRVPGALAGWRIGPPLMGLPVLRIAGVLLLAAGSAGLVDCVLRFAIQGHGTPAPIAPTEALGMSGQYRYVRNPMYPAVVSAIFGQAMLFGSARVFAYGASVWILFHPFVVVYEEPALRRQFGESYIPYKSGVHRWWLSAKPWSPEQTMQVAERVHRTTAK